LTSPLAIQLMRFAFLALLWLFLFGMIRVIRMELRTAGAPRVQVPSKPKSKPKSKKARSAASDGRPGRGALSQLIVTEGSLAGTRVALTGKPILIGRANDSTLVLTDDYASTRHARISENNGVWYLEDLGSTNGTYVGHTKVTGPVPLEAGVVIRIGKTAMELR
jgi:pSer/pThr/pTyr-binding forkhead associated (FHA) protein